MTPRKWVDTNIIIRAVTGHPPEMAGKLPPLLTQAEQGEFELVVPSVIVAECVYVLQSQYFSYTRQQIAYALKAFFSLQGVVLEEQAVILRALSDYERTTVDFQDAYLAAKSHLSGEPVLTWNVKDYNKLGSLYQEP
ncbi:PIN domain-containing protein [Alicyclobacillus shizuokensis]|uniref:PIN domain-containing protein n=1 Tax=Alicyclobacillus shizuokensis TaxID=392014 RepID=UPI000834837E|nr:PIN domain-containing protein [Alicyclobacillus shizuokensis]MCL6625326.1 PIN domain-containing protein [Alicyclobacillus shizuokensis]